MKNFSHSFIPKALEQFKTDSVRYNKAITIYIILLTGLIGSIVYLLMLLVFGLDLFLKPTLVSFIISDILIIITIFISILLLLKGKLEAAGNFSVTAILLNITILAFIRVIKGFGIPSIFVDTYFFMIIFFGFAMIFSTKFYIIFNYLLLLISNWLIYIIGHNKFSPGLKTVYLRATIDFTIELSAIFFIVYYSIYNFDKLLKLFSREKQKNEQTLKELKTILEKIKHTVDLLSKSSQKLNKLSDQVAQSAVNQSLNIEEIASSTQEMNSIIEHSKDLADKTFNQTQQALKQLVHTTQIFDKTIENFFLISEKLKFIQQLADKTDILAINTAIEAAHAGEAGKGFVVIAQEIRKLSDESKKAAAQINDLIEVTQNDSISTKNNFNEMVKRTTEVTVLVENIKYGTEEILKAIMQINTSITELSSISEHNSQAAQELSENSHALVKLANELDNFIN